MPTHAVFPTLIYAAPLQTQSWQPFNKRLLRECLQLREDDESGRKWSAKNYPGGYTSYHSACHMHRLSPTFAALEHRIDLHVKKYARELELDLEGRELAMTDCWVNIMPRQVVHSGHLLHEELAFELEVTRAGVGHVVTVTPAAPPAPDLPTVSGF